MPRLRTSEQILSFGEFEADLQAGELWKAGIRISIQEKPFGLLAILLQRQGELVTRGELRHKLWLAGTYVDFDHSINIAVSKLRQALSDPTEKPRFIETVGSRGYRFLVPVARYESRATRAPGNSDPSSRQRIRVAVLPFEDLTASSDKAYFCEGLTEEIITQLGHLYPQQLGVIAKTSTIRYKHTSKTTRQIGGDLRVDYLIEGSVRFLDNHIRITAQLIQVFDETHRWSEIYDNRLSEPIIHQSEVAGKIARAVGQTLLPAEETSFVGLPIADVEAHKAYLQGRYYQSKRKEEDLRKSITYFEEAIRRDPQYVLAYCGLSDSYSLLGSIGYGGGPPAVFFPKAKQAAQEALQVNDSLAGAHLSLAYVQYAYDWDWSGAERSMRRAIELNPSDAAGHRLFAYFLASRGRTEEAILRSRMALEFDPLSLPAWLVLGATLFHARKYAEAIGELEKVQDLEPNFAGTLMLLGAAYSEAGMFTAAVSSLEKAKTINPGNPSAIAWLANVYARCGNRHEAGALLKQLDELAKQRYVSAFDFALIYVGLGAIDEAVNFLETAYQERSPFLAIVLKVDPRFDGLRQNARFQDLVARVGA